MKLVNVYQLNDFKRYDPALRYRMSDYYHAAKIPLSEFVAKDLVSVAEYLILSSYSVVWHNKKMGPMRAGDLLIITEPGTVPWLSYILSHNGGIRLPEFTSLSLDEYEIPHEELYQHEGPYLAIPHLR